VARNEWQLSTSCARREELLGGPTFEEIVTHIATNAQVVKHKRARSRDRPAYYRAEVCLELPAWIVDLFHNSAAGYRAQYYPSAQDGIAANRYAVEQLVPTIMERVGRWKRTCIPAWFRSSLDNPSSKLWIHQGHWLRFPKRLDRQLFVKRWSLYEWAEKENHKRVWYRLTPDQEPVIDLKGGFLMLDGTPLSVSLKPERDQKLHNAGFT
jgi:hypothetical protein